MQPFISNTEIDEDSLSVTDGVFSEHAAQSEHRVTLQDATNM